MSETLITGSPSSTSLVPSVSLSAPPTASISPLVTSGSRSLDTLSQSPSMSSSASQISTKSFITVAKPTKPNLPVATMSSTSEPTTKSPINAPTSASPSSTSHSSVTTSHDSVDHTTTKAPAPTTTGHPPPKPPISESTAHPSAPPPPPLSKTSTKPSIEETKAPLSKSTRTSTITDHPESTFTSPMAVSVTDTNNGRVFLSTPAVLTILSTSTEPDGEFVTYTHVVANPTGFDSGNQTLQTSGFLNNHGAVAGVFVVVGVFIATVGVCVALLFRRRRRLSRRRRWLEGMQQPPSHNPFEDPQEPPEMRAAENTRSDAVWDGRGPISFGDTRLGPSYPSSSLQRESVGLAGVGSGMSRSRVPVPPESISSHGHGPDQDLVGLLRTVNRDEVTQHSRVVSAQSSPSIYPASLPPDDGLENKHSPTDNESSDYHSSDLIMPAPPRPPRSHLRQSVVKATEIYPMTPPASLSSNSQPPSPVLDTVKGPRDILSRRTLLDVRPRSRDSANEFL